jgi:ATP-dependent Clp protease ATP-binding subunit ClpA
MFENISQNADRRRIVELCGMDPDSILAERDARPVNPPVVHPKLQEAIELAGDDAFRLGQSDIRPENLLFGLLRIGDLPFMFFTSVSRMDLDQFRTDMKDRVRPIEDRVHRPSLPFHPDAQAMIQAAIASATERRRDWVHGLHLLYVLTRAEQGAVADLLAQYGSSALMLNTKLEGAL